VLPTFRRWLSGVGTLLAPRRCAGCDVPLSGDGPFCDRCGLGIEPCAPETLPGSVDLVAAARYGGAIGQAIQKLKYGARPDLGAPLGRFVAIRVGPALGRAERLVVPVPLHPSRLALRGYNQSALLAKALGRALGWPVEPRMLARTRATDEQATLGRHRRLRNVAGAFSLRGAVQARDVVLVDDVVTTGSTALACAGALTSGGARSVAVVSAARAVRLGPVP